MIAAVAVTLLQQCALHCDCCTRDICLKHSPHFCSIEVHSTPASQRALLLHNFVFCRD